jgi:hypothetical protein
VGGMAAEMSRKEYPMESKVIVFSQPG